MTKDAGAVDLFTPVALGPYRLPNRIVMSPMTRQRADPVTAKPTPLMASYYAQRASAGLVVTECVAVSDDAIGYLGAPGIFTKDHVDGWKAVTDAVHESGGKIYIQLWHAGRVSHSSVRNGRLPSAPSAIASPGQTRGIDGRVDLETPREMSAADIAQAIDDFGKAATQAMAAGADGIELHGGFGYLIDSFLQESSNQRADRYGGSVANRARFAVEVVEVVAAAAGANRVGVRLGPSTKANGMHDPNPDAIFGHVVREFERIGISYLHMLEPSANDLTTNTVLLQSPSKHFRPLFSRAQISNTGFDQAKANEFLRSGVSDLVSFGKPFVANPDLPVRFRDDRPLTAVDFSTLFTAGPKGYTDYPNYSS